MTITARRLRALTAATELRQTALGAILAEYLQLRENVVRTPRERARLEEVTLRAIARLSARR